VVGCGFRRIDSANGVVYYERRRGYTSPDLLEGRSVVRVNNVAFNKDKIGISCELSECVGEHKM
jgi:hypothetical protein